MATAEAPTERHYQLLLEAVPLPVQSVVAGATVVAMLALFVGVFSRRRRWLALMLATLAADQASKLLMLSLLRGGRGIEFFWGWLRLGLCANYEQGFGGESPHLLSLTLLVVLLSAPLLWRLGQRNYRMADITAAALSMVAGGCLSILLDRVRLQGGVVDFIEIGPSATYVYNIADLAVLAGGALLLGRGIKLAFEHARQERLLANSPDRL